MPELRFTVLGPVRAIANPDADSITYSSSAALPAPGSLQHWHSAAPIQVAVPEISRFLPCTAGSRAPRSEIHSGLPSELKRAWAFPPKPSPSRIPPVDFGTLPADLLFAAPVGVHARSAP